VPSKRKADPSAQAAELLVRFDVRNPPVPVDRIAKGLGAQVRFSPLDKELSGMIYVSGDTPIIGVNSLHRPNRQRFTIAHEIGHLVLHREYILGKVHVDRDFPVQFAGLNRDAISATGLDDIEIEANQFAAELLMPAALLVQALASKPFDIDDEGPLEELAKKFRVSEQALQYRIRNLSVRK
jgi:Zn-dependent peptidase ImmA (M78 family)